MITGVSTACLYPMETEQALRELASYPIASTEVFLNSHRETEDGFCRNLRMAADEAGMRVLAVHPYTSGFEPFLFFSNYSRRFEDGMEYYRNYYRAAQLLGADYVVFHGGDSHCRLPLEEYFERYLRLWEDAKSFGVELVHENVERCVGRDPGFFREMGRLLPQCGTVLDVKQAIRSGVSPQKMAQAMEGRIRHLHISDHNRDEDCIPIGAGNLDVVELLKTVAAGDTIPGVVLELYRSSYASTENLYTSYKKLRTIAEFFS